MKIRSSLTDNFLVTNANGTRILSSSGASNSATIHQDLTIEGNLTTQGTLSTISTTNLNVSDNLIKCAANNSSDLIDAGLLLTYNTNSARAIIYDQSAARFKLLTGCDITSPPGLTITDGSVAALECGALTATSFTGSGSGLTSLNGSNIASGTVGIAYGGTGQTTYTNGQLLIGNTTGNTLTKATLTGTTNQITVTNGGGSITLSLPQNIQSGAAPTFLGTNFTALNSSNISTGTLAVARGGTGQTTYTNGQLLIGNTTGNTLTKATITGTADQITVTNGTGSITLSLPQSIGTTSDVLFNSCRVTSSDPLLPGIRMNDSNTGLYDAGADIIGFSTAGTQKMLIGTSGIQMDLPLRMAAGSASAPSFSFTGDTNCGIYSSSNDNIDFSTGAGQRLNINTAAVDIKNKLQVGGVNALFPVVTFMLNNVTTTYQTCYLLTDDYAGNIFDRFAVPRALTITHATVCTDSTGTSQTITIQVNGLYSATTPSMAVNESETVSFTAISLAANGLISCEAKASTGSTVDIQICIWGYWT